ncbi:nucleotidyltransferase family protein [Sphingomonas sp.]|uniref:nucleotidyltransferase family protein n=1 Tax=Sphingomonas sp. TaxID=28214 RepID=UPI001B2B8944|nr:nucleotidyltransferase family protein [Sphingomonas sp.]MBO9714031.1 nucleotidyltransferase family protein [Sphingomonas sp.]
MLAPEETALVLLAAGRSRRFDDGDKLAERFLDKPLAYHVVTALEDMPFAARIAVVSETQLDFAALGYEVVENPDPTLGQARSLCFGVEAAEKAGVRAVLVALADMPRVTATHVYRLFDASHGDDTIVASSDGVQPKPPALFGRGHFAELQSLDGDQGGRALIRRGRHVITRPAELADVDTQEDLAELRRLYGLPTDG